jgi:hypothetical protein
MFLSLERLGWLEEDQSGHLGALASGANCPVDPVLITPFLWFHVSLFPGRKSYYRSAAISEVEAVEKTFSTPMRRLTLSARPYRPALPRLEDGDTVRLRR